MKKYKFKKGYFPSYAAVQMVLTRRLFKWQENQNTVQVILGVNFFTVNT